MNIYNNKLTRNVLCPSIISGISWRKVNEKIINSSENLGKTIAR